MATASGRRRSRCRVILRRRLRLAFGSRLALHGNCGGGQACGSNAAFGCRPPVREYERRQGTGLFRRRDHRQSDHRPLAFARQLRHRARDGLNFKGKLVDAKQSGRELGVRYVLEGSVRRLGEKVEVNAQLISAETGAHVWADRFEGERSKLGELQVEVVSRLANSLGVELVKAEALRSMRERPNNPDAVDLAMRASARYNSSGDSKPISSAVIDLGDRALALDPQNERAMVDLANALTDRVENLWSDDPAGDIARADKLADSALALQPDDAWARMAKAEVLSNKRQWRAAISQAEAALADNPNNPNAHANLSFWNMFLGHSEDGFAGVETALRLSPRDPSVTWWQFYMCHLHTHLAQWEQAIEWCGKSIASGNDGMYPYVDLAAANAWAGHDKEAKEAVSALRKLYPDFTVQTWAGIPWSDDPTFNAQCQRIVEGLRKAGLAEGEAKKN